MRLILRSALILSLTFILILILLALQESRKNSINNKVSENGNHLYLFQ